VSSSVRPALETGFQYLCKEPPNDVNPLFQRGFTQEELIELHEKSQEHVKKIKFNVRDFIAEYPMKPEYWSKKPEDILNIFAMDVAQKL
jgi:hypothetical protein